MFISKKYYFYVDVIRSVAIFLVVLLHVSAPFVTAFRRIPLNQWLVANFYDSISNQSVPLFLMISGFLILSRYKSDQLKMFVKKRFLKVFIPFIIWSVFYLFWRIYFHGESLNLTLMFRQFITTKTYYHLGFFYYLLSLYLITPFVYQLIRNRVLIFPFLFLWFIFISINELFRPLKFYSRVGTEMFTPYLGFYVVGYALGNNILLTFKKMGPKVLFLIFLISNLFIFIGTTYLSIWKGKFISVLYIYYTPFVFFSSLTSFLLLKNIKWDIFNRQRVWLTNLIKRVSLISFGIYLIHPIIIELLYRYLMNDSINNIPMHP